MRFVNSNKILPVIAFALLITASLAHAGPWNLDTAELDVSDQLLVGANQSNKATVTIRGLSFYNYGLAVGTSPQVLVKQGNAIVLAPGASMASQGRVERDGDVTLGVVLPAAALSGKIYLQVYTTRRLFGDRDSNLSSVKVVTLLKDLLVANSIKGEKGEQADRGEQGAQELSA